MLRLNTTDSIRLSTEHLLRRYGLHNITSSNLEENAAR